MFTFQWEVDPNMTQEEMLDKLTEVKKKNPGLENLERLVTVRADIHYEKTANVLCESTVYC